MFGFSQTLFVTPTSPEMQKSLYGLIHVSSSGVARLHGGKDCAMKAALLLVLALAGTAQGQTTRPAEPPWFTGERGLGIVTTLTLVGVAVVAVMLVLIYRRMGHHGVNTH
jgi:hypothetical protein